MKHIPKNPALARIQPGDILGVAAWDSTVPPDQQIGRAEVIAVFPARSQSGWKIRLRAESGRIVDLDSDWVIR